MEGPQFSTKAESNLYRSWGMDVIGMTNLQEAKLAREAELCYATVAMVTDYDCWHPEHDSVTVEQMVAVSEERGERRQGGAPRRRGHAEDARLQVRLGAGARHPHRARQDPAAHPPEARLLLGQISRGKPERSITMAMLVVGSVAFDSIKTPRGQVDRILGGSATYFSLAASYFTEVRVVAVVGDDFTAEHESVLKQRGVDTDGIEHARGKTFFWAGEYGDNLNEAKTNFTELNVFENFQPQIPQNIPTRDFLFLANIDPVLQAGGAAADEQAAPGGRRHHEFLDQRQARRNWRRR